MIVWLTGQPGSGKTTIAKMIISHVGSEWFHIDGDDTRELFNNKDYSEQGRRENVKVVQQLSQYLHSKNKHAVVSLVSPYKDQREDFKNKMGSAVVEVYVHTSENRNKESFFVEGYEKPTENFIDICTDNISVEECVKKLLL
jgi:adenylylsulfate kinase